MSVREVIAAPQYAELDEETDRLFREKSTFPPGDPRAARVRDRLIELHLPAADRLARRFGHHGDQMDDLVQVARLALVHAVDRFDPTYGVPFHGFAVPTVTGELKHYLRDRGWHVRVSRRLQELRLGIAQASDELTHLLGRSPTVADLARHLNVDEEAVIEGLEAGHAYRAVSLDSPIGGPDGEVTLVDRLGGEDPALAMIDNHDALRRIVATLPERERRIVALRFFGNLNQTDIARQLGISQMHVSRLLRHALDTIRDRMAED